MTPEIERVFLIQRSLDGYSRGELMISLCTSPRRWRWEISEEGGKRGTAVYMEY
jgi:hypothetical protein